MPQKKIVNCVRFGTMLFNIRSRVSFSVEQLPERPNTVALAEFH
jgi:hypothetical protein